MLFIPFDVSFVASLSERVERVKKLWYKSIIKRIVEMRKINKFIVRTYMKHMVKDSCSKDDRDKIEYILMTIFSEFEKLCLLYLAFFALDRENKFVICMLVLLGTRRYIGGFHANTFLGCLFISFSYILLAIIISEKVEILHCISFFVYSVSIFNIICFAPLYSENRPEFTIKQKKKMKFKCVIWLALIILVGELLEYENLIVALLMIQQLEMIIHFFLKVRKG